MTEPTDADIESAWTEATGSSILPYPDDMLAFARAVLAKWGTPAGAGEVVATVIKKGADRQWMSERLGNLPDGIYSLYLAPQPTQAQAGAVPLTDEEITTAAEDNDNDSAFMAGFATGVQFAERRHGIKGGQHGTDT